MTLAADLAADYSIIDGTESVTLTPANPAGTAINGITALRRALSKRDLQMLGVIGIEPSDLAWHLWASFLGSTTPKNGDTIEDAAGVTYTILSATKDTLGSRWRCVCRQEV